MFARAISHKPAPVPAAGPTYTPAQSLQVLQPKLTGGSVDDPFEREADDQVAQRVRHGFVSTLPPHAPGESAPPPPVPRYGSLGSRIFRQELARQPAAGIGRAVGLPENLKAGVENLSGYSMDDVRVHYNSDQPAQLNAHAYAQGTDIHVAAGQERHLPHEAWHVVQQKQGRVRPTMHAHGVDINDNPGLEMEADVIGRKAVQTKNANPSSGISLHESTPVNNPVQVVQRVTSVGYGTRQNYSYANPAAAGGVLNTIATVGRRAEAHLDLTDPIKGSTVGGGQIPAGLMTDLNLNFPAVPGGGWGQGHLLNYNLGGVGLTHNLFPITTAANNKHTSVESEVKELLYNQPALGVFNLAANGYLQYSVDAVPVGGVGTATTQAPDADFNITYRTQQSQVLAMGAPVGPPVWNPAKNITITSRAAGSTAVPAAWAPFGAGLGMPMGAINVAVNAVAVLTNALDPGHAAMLAALGVAAAPAVPAGAVSFLTQQAPAGGPALKIIGWQF